MDFYYDLRDYMFTDKSFSFNYFGKVIKLFMGEAKELSWHANEIYKSKAFIKLEEETDAVYNDIEQLKAIHSFDLTSHLGPKNALYLYVLGAWNVLHFQDYSVLVEKAQVYGNFIHIETKKKFSLRSDIGSHLLNIGNLPPRRWNLLLSKANNQLN